MKRAILLLGIGLFTLNVFGGAETIIRERAKELRNQNNVRQGVPPPIQPGQTPSAPSATPPAQSPALQKLRSDLAAIRQNSQVTPAQKQTIARDFAAVAQGARPTDATSARFAEEVSAALSEKPLSAAGLSRFIQEIDAILNPAKYPQAKPEGIFADVQAIFQENGLKRNRAVTISEAVKAAAGEVKR
jgi:hypothetical protein